MLTGVGGIVRRLRSSLRRQGFLESLLKSYVVMADHWFDIRYGTDTCAWAQLSTLTIDSVNKQRGYAYQPTRLVPLTTVFKVIRPLITPESVLVDFGSGKGRVLLVALECGFTKVRGVEFAHDLCAIAQNNYAAYQSKTGACADYRIIESDVTDYPIGTDEDVFFFFNPFDARILTRVLVNITASLQAKWRPIVIVYFNPRHGDIIDQMNDCFLKVKEHHAWGYPFVVYANRVAASAR